MEIDLAILRSVHAVQEVEWRRNPIGFLRACVQTLRGALWADMIVAWFGSYHAFFAFLPALLLRRKRVIIASGYDVANEPTLNYGGLRSGMRRWMGLQAFRWADQVLAVSHFSAQEALKNAHVVPEKLQTIYHGLDADAFAPPDDKKERRGVLTVAVINQESMLRKGLALFVETAKQLPDIPFILVGPWRDSAIDELRALAPPNVTFAGALFGNDLVQCMASAQVYAQLSAYESFGMAVAEAMLCGCVPVVTDRGALPEVVGDQGWIAPYADIEVTAQVIRQALAADSAMRHQCRQRIVEHFSLAARRTQLLRALETVRTSS
ncbi:MAG: glycosyltransferase family 4 protein [Chloroflexota bacterium]|nr:glycosyltransferase family 4 protein [Chloroflexota bacterium]